MGRSEIIALRHGWSAEVRAGDRDRKHNRDLGYWQRQFYSGILPDDSPRILLRNRERVHIHAILVIILPSVFVLPHQAVRIGGVIGRDRLLHLHHLASFPSINDSRCCCCGGCFLLVLLYTAGVLSIAMHTS